MPLFLGQSDLFHAVIDPLITCRRESLPAQAVDRGFVGGARTGQLLSGEAAVSYPPLQARKKQRAPSLPVLCKCERGDKGQPGLGGGCPQSAEPQGLFHRGTRQCL